MSTLLYSPVLLVPTLTWCWLMSQGRCHRMAEMAARLLSLGGARAGSSSHASAPPPARYCRLVTEVRAAQPVVLSRETRRYY